jgi:putative methionine-R-sulfoxide reductase with GAF domain
MILKWNLVADVDAYESYISCGGKSNCAVND